MQKLLVNPFENYAEKQLLLFGLASAVAGSLAAYYFNARFDGAIDFHIVENVSLAEPFIDNGISIFSLMVFMLAAGKAINKKVRLIDILNTILIARAPYCLLPLCNAGGYMHGMFNEIAKNPLDASPNGLQITLMALFAIIAIVFLIWFVLLLYNGFKIAVNSKTAGHKALFVLSVLLAEALSKLLLSLIY